MDTTWEGRLGWTAGLVADDPVVRVRAQRRLTVMRRLMYAALRRLYAVPGRLDDPERAGLLAHYRLRQSFCFPEGLGPKEPLGTSACLPYLIRYLEWEVRYPDEWYATAKDWTAKEVLLRHLTREFADLPVAAKRRLVELVVLVIRREYHVEDVSWARLARAVDLPEFRGRLAELDDGTNAVPAKRARFLLWLLDHPEAPQLQRIHWHYGRYPQPRRRTGRQRSRR
ncbi:hypothetical protein ACFPIJ_58960 [Dactylosporangium cerinum]|uniref:Uncharacterized protein n=1 Tax=Dactylosporangium cerinum TaxID=1434730 RepID=A0ABV9WFZ3_9ACTN